MKRKFFLFVMFLILLTTGCTLTKENYINEITFDKYKEMIENKESFVLEMMSQSCSHCDELKPKLEEFAKEYKIDIKYIDNYKLTKDEKNELKSYTGTLATPTIFFYVNGEETSTKTRIVGDVSNEKLIEKFKENGYIK